MARGRARGRSSVRGASSREGDVEGRGDGRRTRTRSSGRTEGSAGRASTRGNSTSGGTGSGRESGRESTRRSSRSVATAGSTEVPEIVPEESARDHDVRRFFPARKKRKGDLQLCVTKELLQNVSRYVHQELLVSDIAKRVSEVVRFSEKTGGRVLQEEKVTEYVRNYIEALLKYRLKCSDPYSEGVDPTSRIAISNIPSRNTDEHVEGRKLLDALRKEGLPSKFPAGVRVTSRNDLLLAFRCFTKHREGKPFYPFLRPNKELLALPGFSSREDELASVIPPPERALEPFIWDALRGSLENFSVDAYKFKALRLKRFPGVESFRLCKEFWKAYVHVTLRRRIAERTNDALESLRQLHFQGKPESWLQAVNISSIGHTNFTQLLLRKKCLGKSIYENRQGGHFLRQDDVCVLWIEQRDGRDIKEHPVRGFLGEIGDKNFQKTWLMFVPGIWKWATSEISVQAVPFYNMTTDIRRAQAIILMGQMDPSIHRTCFSPQAVRGIICTPRYYRIPGDGAAQMVFEHYMRELNAAQGEVLDKIMKALSTSQEISGNGLIVVQGPPGTGKSKTIVCAVALLLAKLEFPEYKDRKILVCAPSNAAVDVIARRLLEGIQVVVPDEKDLSLLKLKRKAPSMLRIGHGSTDRALQPINLDDKIEYELDRRGIVHPKEKRLRSPGIEKELLQGAKIWCSTLMNMRQAKYEEVNPRFLGVIVDEAGQAIEIDCLMPMLPFQEVAAPLCILVGDTKQLSPFEDIQEGRELVEMGLMGRIVGYMQHTSDNCVRLQEQYRMHHAISRFPAEEFYAGHLKNASVVYDARIFDRPYHYDSAGRFGPVTFIDTSSMVNNEEYYPRGRSACNYCEAKVIESLVTCLVRLHEGALKDGIVLLSPYSRQLELLSLTTSRVPEMRNVSVSISTVDSMQGDEAGVVVMSTVRSNLRKDLGFLIDYRRMNVGMTRAKYSLIVVGDSKTLQANETWRRFIDYCRDDENICTHYISLQGRNVNQGEVTRRLFPENLISTGELWKLPRF